MPGKPRRLQFGEFPLLEKMAARIHTQVAFAGIAFISLPVTVLAGCQFVQPEQPYFHQDAGDR